VIIVSARAWWGLPPVPNAGLHLAEPAGDLADQAVEKSFASRRHAQDHEVGLPY